ncbi:MAG: hypothetical protein ACRDZW_01730 [Acidimicrobiales bacterium]
MEPVLNLEELAEAMRTAGPPTADDVCITSDGRRLDTKEKLLAFLAEINADRAAGASAVPPTR